MPIPYLTPLSPWAVDVFELREKNKLLSMYSNPWIIISSGAKLINGPVAKGDAKARATAIYNILEGITQSPKQYNGCILANSIGTMPDWSVKGNSDFMKNGGSLNLSYSLGATPVGIDFDGKVITVEGEVGRKVSMPIIESMDLDTDGTNNTLKTAKVNVRCFTLKQLEMFEMFFMKPGMNVLIEFGDSALDILRNPTIVRDSKGVFEPQQKQYKFDAFQNGERDKFEPFTSITEAFVPKTNYDKFCENFSSYFRCDNEAIGNYLSSVRRSIGSYDRVAGKVINYSFSIENDGTYIATFDVSQSNQIAFAMPKSKPRKKGKAKAGKPAATNFDPYTLIKNIIISDFNLDSKVFNDLLTTITPGDKKSWMDNFFNFLKKNDKQKDTTTSDKAYMSLRFVLRILANYSVAEEGIGTKAGDFFELKLPGFCKTEPKTPADSAEDKLLRIIPVASHPYLLSSTEDVIYPRQKMPKPSQPNKKDNPDATEVELIIPSKNAVDGTINGYNFDTDKQYLWLPGSHYNDAQPHKITPGTVVKNATFGDALNIFINYKIVVEAWNSSFTRIQFLENILNIVNKNSYGLFQLVVGLPVNNGQPVVMDIKNTEQTIYEKDQPKDYRFKPTTVNSMIKEFKFNFEMSNLVAGMTIFNNRKTLLLAKEKKTKDAAQYTLPLPPQAYKSVDNSLYANADGYYSVNQVEYLNLKVVKQQLDEKAKQNLDEEDPKKDDDVSEKPPSLSDVIKEKSKMFTAGKSTRMLIYKDTDLIYKNINTNEDAESIKSTITPIEVTITMGGFSGFTSGQYFNIDGVPEIYNIIGVFQIKNIKHNVTKEGWTTTIEAGFKVLNKVK